MNNQKFYRIETSHQKNLMFRLSTVEIVYDVEKDFDPTFTIDFNGGNSIIFSFETLNDANSERNKLLTILND